MIYPQNFEQKIGFDQIRQLLKEKCLSTLGEERVTDMAFSDRFSEVEEHLDQVFEFVRILREEDNFPAQYFFDVRPSLKRIRVEGMYLDEQELFDLRRSLETIRDIVRFLQKSEGEEEETASHYPCLKRLAGDITVFPQLIGKINGILSPYGKIKDNASAELARIRRELASTMGSISRSLNNILRNAQSEGIVDKDVAPTMRDGRLVIPVVPALKRKIKGIVHDESASGKTVFIEPAEVVEANNRIRELEGDERREIIRILVEFSNLLRPSIPRHPTVIRISCRDRLHTCQSIIFRTNHRIETYFRKQTGFRLDNGGSSVAATLSCQTWKESSAAGYRVERKATYPHHLRTECRWQIRLSENRRTAAIHVTMRLANPDARTQPCRYIQQYIH